MLSPAGLACCGPVGGACPVGYCLLGMLSSTNAPAASPPPPQCLQLHSSLARPFSILWHCLLTCGRHPPCSGSTNVGSYNMGSANYGNCIV